MIANKFEDLLFWQKTRALTTLIYTYTRNGEFKKDYGLQNQIQRSSVSVMSKYRRRFWTRWKSRIYSISVRREGSLSEVKSQLYVAIDQCYITKTEFNNAYAMTEEISKLINAFIKNLKDDKKRGLKT